MTNTTQNKIIYQKTDKQHIVWLEVISEKMTLQRAVLLGFTLHRPVLSVSQTLLVTCLH